jgi:hypothetical protein
VEDLPPSDVMASDTVTASDMYYDGALDQQVDTITTTPLVVLQPSADLMTAANTNLAQGTVTTFTKEGGKEPLEGALT